MFVSELHPPPKGKVRFAYPGLRKLPDTAGCYALANVDDIILYIGQSKDIARRVVGHFDDREKRATTPHGIAFWCYYLPISEPKLNALERGWLNSYQLTEGKLPYFNKVGAPV